MTDKLTRGLQYLLWLTHAQGERFLNCRREGHECAFRFQSGSGKKRSGVPMLCGYIEVSNHARGASEKGHL